MDECLDPIYDIGRWLEPKELFGSADISVGLGDITGLHGEAIDLRLASYTLFNRLDQLIEPRWMTISEVDDFTLQSAVKGSDHSRHDIVDERVISARGG